jgi:hypothetical protein
MSDNPQEKTIAQEAGLPDNWHPIDTAPIVPGAPPAQSPLSGSDRYLQGSLPSAYQQDVDFTRTAYEGSSTPKLSIMPLGIQGQPSANAAVQSTASITIPFSGTPTPVVGSGMNFCGVWGPSTLYSIYDVVIFNLSAYVASEANSGQQPDNTPLVWELLSENLVFNPIPLTPGAPGFGAFDKSTHAHGATAPISAGPLVPANSQGWAVLAEVNIGNPGLLPSYSSPVAVGSIGPSIGFFNLPTATPVFVNYGFGRRDWATNLLLFAGTQFSLTASATAAQIVSNVLTVTCPQSFIAGTNVSLSGFSGTLTFLNGVSGTITSVTPTNFTLNFTYADQALTSGAGVATNAPYLQMATSTGFSSFPHTLTLSNPVQKGSTILVAVLNNAASSVGAISSVSDGVNSYAFANSQGSPNGGYANLAWATNVASGTPTITVNGTFSGSISSAFLVMMELPGDVGTITTYVPYDVVEFRGSTFVCTAETTEDPFTNITGWALIAQGTGSIDLLSASYLAVANDYGRLLTNTSSSNITVTLPATPPTNPISGGASWWIAVQASGSGTVTISPNSLLLDGSSSSLVLTQNSGVLVYTDGLNYYTMRGLGTLNSFAMTVPSWLTAVVTNPNGPNTSVAITATSETANFVLAAPNGSAGALAPRLLVGADIPAINLASSGKGGVTGLLPHANIAATAVTPGSYTSANITVQADGTLTAASNGGGGAPTNDVYVLGSADVTNLPNAVVNPTAAFGADAAPASPGTLNDEFPGSVLSGSWTQVNTPVINVAGSILGITAVANSGTNWFSVLKTAPGTPWTVVAKVTLIGLNAASAVCGLVLTDGTATVNKLIVFGPTVVGVGAANEELAIYRYLNYTTFSGTSISIAMSGKSYYLSVQDTGTDLVYSFSLDGINFMQVFSESRTAFFTSGPTNVGLGIDEENAGISSILSCDWFRRTQ